jgi:hypothetical protein
LIRDFRYLAWGASDLETLDGGENPKVGEHFGAVVFELEVYPEPKSLSAIDLREIFSGRVTIQMLADRTGLSWSGVQERLRPTRVWNSKQKRFVQSGRADSGSS